MSMENTTTPPRKKRAYVKKRILTQDELWKSIVPLLWVPFLHFCLEDWVDKIDFTREPDSLDKDLKRLMPRGKAKNRSVDFLIRVYFKDGTTKCFLLHIEVQGYADPNFELRVFQYYYRIKDKFQEPLETLVIMIDEDPDYRPDNYREAFGQTELNFKFRMFKLLDNPPPYLGKEENPFSIVFEVAWYALKQNKLKTDKDLRNLRFGLIKRLLEKNIEEKMIYGLFDFINIYLPFKNSKNELTFDRELDVLIDKDKEMEVMTIRERYDHNVKIIMNRLEGKLEKAEVKSQQLELQSQQWELQRQGLELQRQEEARLRQEEARLRQESEGKMLLAIRHLYAQGMSVEMIASIMSQSIDSVQDILEGKL